MAPEEEEAGVASVGTPDEGAGAVDAESTASPAETSLSAESEAQPSAAFDWVTWEGETDSLPDGARAWAAPFKTHYSKGLEEKVSEAEELKKIYDSLLSENADPRVPDLEAKIKELEEAGTASTSEWETKYSALEKQHQEYQATIEAAIEKEAEDYSKWFQQENPDIFENEALAEVFVGLMDEGWDMETAAKAVRLPAPLLQAARQAKADGVPDSYALRLAGRAERPAAPRPGAKLTAGATAPARSREQAMLPDKVQPTSFKDLRNQVARTALKRSS